MSDLKPMREAAERQQRIDASLHPGKLKHTYSPETILALIACAEALIAIDADPLSDMRKGLDYKCKEALAQLRDAP